MTSIRSIFLPALAVATAVFVSGCKKEDAAASGGGGGGGGGSTLTLSSNPGAQMTIDGLTVSWATGATWEGVVGSSGSGNWSYSSGIFNIGTGEGIEAEVGYSPGAPPSTAQFTAMFNTGARNYVASANNAVGVEVRYFDTLGDVWSSSCPVGTQTGSAFNITGMQVLAGAPYDTVKVLLTFNCKVYNCNGGGASKTITGGTLRLNFENI